MPPHGTAPRRRRGRPPPAAVRTASRDAHVGAAPVELPRPLDVHLGVAQLAKGRGQRPAEGAKSGDRLQVVERLALPFLEGGVRGDRFRRQRARGGESGAGQIVRSDAPDDLPQTETVEAERRADVRGDISREVVGRLPRLTDEQRFTALQAAPEPFGSSLDAGLRRRGRQDRDARGRRQAIGILAGMFRASGSEWNRAARAGTASTGRGASSGSPSASARRGNPAPRACRSDGTASPTVSSSPSIPSVDRLLPTCPDSSSRFTSTRCACLQDCPGPLSPGAPNASPARHFGRSPRPCSNV